MDPRRLRELLEKLQRGEVELGEAEAALRRLPFEKLDDMAVVDHHRPLRAGVPEVVFGESKSAEEIARIMSSLAAG
ncbi:MAG TPA: 1-(5-phosphoribosyl)-5-amino-4-imidazole-carboxylate carboxylase, partial [Kofleriaceae bacterium]|nr:1-(5-phosphoribosyl)-5-amino-4-imidazole-carboxylate carboxylase [Kofleriaceae bacterium]